MSRELTPVKKALLRWIAAWWRDHGYGPSMREIGHAFCWSSDAAAAYGHLRRLRAKGLVRWEPRQPRTIRLTAAGRRASKPPTGEKLADLRDAIDNALNPTREEGRTHG